MPRHAGDLTEWRPALRLLGPLAEHGIRSLTAAMAPGDADDAARAAVAADVAAKINVMPMFIALPIAGLTVFFDWSAALRFGVRARNLTPDKVRHFADIWKRAPLSPVADLVLVYERLTPFVYFSRARSRS